MTFPIGPSSASASRQKNCNSCVQAKRRCDRRTPICSRCVEKQLRCNYGKERVQRIPHRDDTERTPLVTDVSMSENLGCSLFCQDSSLDLGYLDTLPESSRSEFVAGFTPVTVMDAYSTDELPMDTFMNLITNKESISRDQWLIQPNDAARDERPGTPVNEETADGYREMTALCEHIQPWHVYDPKSPIYHTVNRVKDFPLDMAKQNSTPFLHRYLYRDHAPRCITSCFATTVLYANRTPANTAMVMRALHRSVHELIQTEGGRVAITPVEKLARAQSLFLHEIICLFDGDIALRALGEKHTPLLKAWLGDLCKIRDNLGGLSLADDGSARQQTPGDWERWIFAESLRRTIIIAYGVLSMYEIMKDPKVDVVGGPWAFTHRWTIARSLWEADSPFEFSRAWRETPRFVIANYALSKFVQNGRGEDVDEFAEILLSIYMGPDATQEFISSRRL